VRRLVSDHSPQRQRGTVRPWDGPSF